MLQRYTVFIETRTFDFLRLRHLQLQRRNYHCVHAAVKNGFLDQDNFMASHDVVTL